jgi:hypothetical protein
MVGRFREFNAVQLRISIDRIEPQIWRRLAVPLHFNLRELHLVLQAAFGWTNSHLHEFEIGGLRFGDADTAENGPDDVFRWPRASAFEARRDFRHGIERRVLLQEHHVLPVIRRMAHSVKSEGLASEAVLHPQGRT